MTIIVGNREPSFPLPPRTHFVQVDFPPPAAITGPHADRDGFVLDKGSKIGLGLAAARDHGASWVMVFDADDFVHRDLTRFVGQHPDAAGWVIDEGWVYSRTRNGFRPKRGFNRTCGTSYVIPLEAYQVPETLSTRASQEEVVSGFGDVLPNIIGAHRNAVRWHAERGRVLRSLPFRGAVYQVDTGENHSGREFPELLLPWHRRLGEAFGVRSQLGRMATLRACLGPSAIVQTAAALARRVTGRLLARSTPATRA